MFRLFPQLHCWFVACTHYLWNEAIVSVAASGNTCLFTILWLSHSQTESGNVNAIIPLNIKDGTSGMVRQFGMNILLKCESHYVTPYLKPHQCVFFFHMNISVSILFEENVDCFQGPSLLVSHPHCQEESSQSSFQPSCLLLQLCIALRCYNWPTQISKDQTVDLRRLYKKD